MGSVDRYDLGIEGSVRSWRCGGPVEGSASAVELGSAGAPV